MDPVFARNRLSAYLDEELPASERAAVAAALAGDPSLAQALARQPATDHACTLCAAAHAYCAECAQGQARMEAAAAGRQDAEGGGHEGHIRQKDLPICTKCNDTRKWRKGDHAVDPGRAPHGAQNYPETHSPADG
jgi:hypothetical protein